MSSKLENLKNTLFAKNFLFSNIFTMKKYKYDHPSFPLSFDWKFYISKDNTWPPFYRSIVVDKKNFLKEVIELHMNGVIIDYKIYNLNDTKDFFKK
jgi:hypothetical protein